MKDSRNTYDFPTRSNINGKPFFSGAKSKYSNPIPTVIQRKEVFAPSETTNEEKKEEKKAKRGNSFWKDLFTRPFKAIGRLFGSENYSKDELSEYLNYLKVAKRIEDRYDSDNKARALVKRQNEFEKFSTDVKILLIREMMKGATWGADERAIIKLFKGSAIDEMETIVISIGRPTLWDEFGGRNRRIIEAVTLTEADLNSPSILNRLKSLSAKELEDYKTHARVGAVSTLATKLIQLKDITTPLEVSNVESVDEEGTATLNINGFEVRVFKDRATEGQGNNAGTVVDVNPGKIEIKETTVDQDTVTVKSWTGPSRPIVTIQTFYDANTGTRGSNPSVYGRGTTQTDEFRGDTSLRFHEGRHGLDALQYLREHAPPAFSGRVGMTVAEFTDAIDEYKREILKYDYALSIYSIRETDCPGVSIPKEKLEEVGAPIDICD